MKSDPNEEIEPQPKVEQPRLERKDDKGDRIAAWIREALIAFSRLGLEILLLVGPFVGAALVLLFYVWQKSS